MSSRFEDDPLELPPARPAAVPPAQPGGHASHRGRATSHRHPPATPQQRRRWYEVVCGVLVGVMAVWEFGMFPVKAYLITHLTLSTVITTDQVAEVGLGAKAAFNHHRAIFLPLIWAVAVLSTLKWHLVAFWAGKLWGHDALAHWSGSSRRSQAITRAVVWMCTRVPAVAIFLAYLLSPIATLVYAALGMADLGWRRFLKYDLVGSALATFAWIYIGFYVGRPAVNLLERYSKFSTWVAVAMAVLLVAFVVWRRLTRDSRRIKSEAKQAAKQEANRRIAEVKAQKAASRRARRDAVARRFSGGQGRGQR